MRWNCPHCSVALAVSDEKLGGGWSFSRCFKCGGFALVRRSDVNLIKVDRAPTGEKIILPESSETPMISSEATRNLTHRDADPARPTIRPATRRRSPPPIAAAARILSPPAPAPKVPPPRFTPRVETRGVSGSHVTEANPLANGLPEPLPEAPIRVAHLRYRLLPAAIGAAGVLAIGSGIYLYIQGQELWRKARVSAMTIDHREAITANAPAALAPIVPIAPVIAPEAIAPAATSAPPAETAAVAPAAAIPVVLAQAAPVQAPVIDQVHQHAMAPVRTEAPADEAPATTSPLVVQPKQEDVALRAGPGLEHRIIGHADSEIRYVVSGWKDRWFKIQVTANDLADGAKATKTAWVRNDLVELISGR